MWTLLFWKGVVERAVRTFCQVLAAALAVSGADETGLTAADWMSGLGLSLAAMFLSVVTSLVAVLRDTDPVPTPSLVRTMPVTLYRRPVPPPGQPPNIS